MRLDYLSYVLIVVVGIVVATGVFGKMIFGWNIESDWFWFLTGMGLAFEGIIALKKQKKFDKKYKIIER
ncbi:hypothetical protein KAS08_04655 [Candidatus Pacearchaeota archaeon]|nr:hypothetical protein [Candidatus Pacearchaeota archaeon]